MPTPTYTALATVTLGSSASSVTFSSIPATYRDLILICDALSDGAPVMNARFNSDSASNYSYVFMLGNGSTTSSGTATSTGFDIAVLDSSARQMVTLQIMDYSATDKHKTGLSRRDRAGEMSLAQANRWANTNAITTMTLGLSSNNFAASSTFNLYGVIA
jgi:hypothetical protein